jgi:hypothetical protein
MEMHVAASSVHRRGGPAAWNGHRVDDWSAQRLTRLRRLCFTATFAMKIYIAIQSWAHTMFVIEVGISLR